MNFFIIRKRDIRQNTDTLCNTVHKKTEHSITACTDKIKVQARKKIYIQFPVLNFLHQMDRPLRSEIHFIHSSQLRNMADCSQLDPEAHYVAP